MAKDVLITPLDGIIQFSSSAGTGTGQVKVDGDDLVISNAIGDVLLGDGASDVFIGNGTDNVDIVFEQNGEIRDDGSGKTLTLGSKTTTLILSSSSDITMQGGGGNVGIGTTSPKAELHVEGTISASLTGSFGKATIGTPTPSNSQTQLTVKGGEGGVAMAHFERTIGGTGIIKINSNASEPQIQFKADNDNERMNIGVERAGGAFVIASGSSIADKEIVVVTQDNKVGINTTAPTKELTVEGDISSSGFISTLSHITASGDISASRLFLNSGTSDTVATFKSSDSTARIQITDDNTTNYIVSNTNSDSTLLSLGANNSTHAGNLNISSSGAVGIGTTTPGYALEVVGSISSSATLISKNINVAEKIVHLADANTEIHFEPDKVTHTVGGVDFITMTETTNDTLAFGDVETSFAGNITASGNISASGTITANAINVNGTDVLTSVSGNTFATDLKIGRDADNLIDFTTDNQIQLRVGASNELKLNTSTLFAGANDGLSLGAAAIGFSDLFLADGAVIGFNNGEIHLTQTNAALVMSGSGATTLEVLGNVSGSSTSTGSFGHLEATKAMIGKHSIYETDFPSADSTLHIHEIVNDAGGVDLGNEAHIVISTGTTQTGAQGYQGSLWFGTSDHPAAGGTANVGTQFVWRNAGIASQTSGDTGVATGKGNLEFYTNNGSGTATKRLEITEGGAINALSHITASGNISASGKLFAYGADFGDQSITNVNQIDLDGFRADAATNVQVTLGASGVDVVMEDGDSFTINSGEVNADFTYFDSGEASLIHGDAALSRVGISDTSPVSKLDVGGDLNVQSHITASGNISSSGAIITEQIYVGSNIFHNGDTNTNITFGTDTITFKAGNETFITIIEDGSQDNIVIGDGGDIDFHVKAGGDNTLFAQGSSQNIGIGTSSPTLGRLHISGSGTSANYSILAQTTSSVNYMKFANSSTGDASGDGFDIGANGTTAYLLNRENANMIFSTDDTERVRILAGGNVGIGTTSPTKELTVAGEISASSTITSKTGFVGEIQTTGSYDFPGAIVGYTNVGSNSGHASYTITTSYAVPDSEMNVVFVVPKSGKVEIMVQVQVNDTSTSSNTISCALSDAASYNTLGAQHEVSAFSQDETGTDVKTIRWSIEGLTAGTTLQYWFAVKANVGSTGQSLQWGGSGTGRFPDFIMKATALPSNSVFL
jgi:hypothetical protein